MGAPREDADGEVDEGSAFELGGVRLVGRAGDTAAASMRNWALGGLALGGDGDDTSIGRGNAGAGAVRIVILS